MKLYRSLDRPWFKRLWKDYLHSKGVDPKFVVKMASDIYDDFLKGNHFDHALQVFFDLCATIDQIGGERYRDEDYLLIRMIIECWIANEPFSEKDHQAIEALIKSYSKYTEGFEHWYCPKLMIAERLLADQLNTIAFINRFRYPKSVIDQMAEVSGQDVKSRADLLAQGIEQKRQYGIKTSFFQDYLFHGFSEAWVILNTDTWVDQLKQFSLSPQAYCIVGLSNVREVRDKKRLVAERIDSPGQLVRYGYDLESKTRWCLVQKGELDHDIHGLMSVRDQFAKQGKEVIYDLVRLSVLAHIYDLTVPLEVVRTLPELPRPRNILERLPIPTEKRIQRLTDPTLILPRIRWLEQDEKLTELFDAEMDQAEADTNRLAHRVVREHEVTWFIRRLPKGYRASSEAHQKATEFLGQEFTLPEGMTFVSSHLRGKGHAPVEGIHRIIDRE